MGGWDGGCRETSASNVLCRRAVSEQGEHLKDRTKRFALEILTLAKQLPAAEPGPTIRRQLTKSATSVAANYRASCRARSQAEFVARLGIVVEEADEALF